MANKDISASYQHLSARIALYRAYQRAHRAAYAIAHCARSRCALPRLYAPATPRQHLIPRTRGARAIQRRFSRLISGIAIFQHQHARAWPLSPLKHGAAQAYQAKISKDGGGAVRRKEKNQVR